jgi:hypothetical protein
MALHWPENPPRGPRQGLGPSRPLVGDPLGPTRELFEAAEPGGPRRRWWYLLPIVVVIALLALVGFGLALFGPLPTVLPGLDCGACEIRR